MATSTSVSWCVDRSFDRPFLFRSTQPRYEHVERDPGELRQFRESELFSAILVEFCGAAVSSLLFPGCPTTVLRGISFSVVNSLKSEFSFFSGSLAHVRKEVFERTPATTHSYLSESVVLVRRATELRTTREHVRPRRIRRRVPAHPSVSVTFASHHAAARTGFSLTELIGADPFFCATRTEAPPVNATFSFFVRPNDFESTKDSVAEIQYLFGHVCSTNKRSTNIP